MKLYEIVFSPTGGTKKVSEILTGALRYEPCRIDLCDSQADFSSVQMSSEDVAIIAVPSYGGRVPAVAIERITKIHGNGARASLVCVYGNRAYEDTLAELEDAAKQAGFRVIAAVAAVAEHSIARQFASGRPDSQDAGQLADFTEQIKSKLSAQDDTTPSIPGNRPYKEAGKSGMVPKPTRKCVNCGLCAAQCPVQAIDKGNSRKVDKNLCISCMGCISACPHYARRLNPVMHAIVGLALKKVCSQRKENELFI